jgi:hypothetical protein
MSAIQFLLDLSKSQVRELYLGIRSVAEPFLIIVESMLMVFSQLEFTSLKGSLALWSAGMKPARIVNPCTNTCRLIKVVEQIILDEEPR